MGAGSLSIWTHNLKDFEFLPSYTVQKGNKKYEGPAVKVGAGVESWELFNHMARNNITVVAPGGGTVGPVGGWVSVAGHGSLTTKYGLGADQVLEISVVTADGRFLTVGPNTPEPDSDLWWALRGGGGSKFIPCPQHKPPQKTTPNCLCVQYPLTPSRHIRHHNLSHLQSLPTNHHHLGQPQLRPHRVPHQ